MANLKTVKPETKKAIPGAKTPNKGIHWEYRLFGTLSKNDRTRLESVCSTPVESGDVKDRYLWSAGCASNIKIRKKKLKFKRLLEATPDGFELWDEGKHLKFNFPLDGATIEMLEKELRAQAPDELKTGCASADELTARMLFFTPAIQSIVVEKHRSRCAFLCQDTPIQLEIAELRTPVAVTSIALECVSTGAIDADKGLRVIRAARDALELPDSFEAMGYVQFLGRLVKDGLLDSSGASGQIDE